MFQSQPNRHIPSRSIFFCTRRAKMWLFSGRMWQKTSQVKKNTFVCESVTLFPEMWQMWRVTFFVTRKSDKCDVTHTRTWRNPGQTDPRPTQSIMYVPLRVNRSQKCILLIVQYKYIKSCSGDFDSPESDPPQKIMRYWVYYSTQLSFGFLSDRICQIEMICIGGVPVLKTHFGGAGP